MAIHACRSGDRSFHRVTSVEDALVALRAALEQWRTFTLRLLLTRSVTGGTDPSQWAGTNLCAGTCADPCESAHGCRCDTSSSKACGPDMRHRVGS